MKKKENEESSKVTLIICSSFKRKMLKKAKTLKTFFTDLKENKQNKISILHLTDAATKYSAVCLVAR